MLGGNAEIRNVRDNARVLNCSGNAYIETLGHNVITHIKSEKDLRIEASKETLIITWGNGFDDYMKVFPTEIKGKNAILYKAVHKTEDGRLVSHNDSLFEYKIGETHKHECNPSTKESCTYGLHVSHKQWALRFGKRWEDMALIEVLVPIDKIVVAEDCDGKVRTSELKVIREVSKEEW